MKHQISKFIALSIIFLLFNSCINKHVKRQSLFLDQFFSNKQVAYALNEYSNNNIVIYDENKTLIKFNEVYQSDSISIKVQNNFPVNTEFYRVYEFALNKDLSYVALTTSDKQKGILFFMKKKEGSNKWYLVNFSKKYMR